jgi:hypothetical protein
MLNKLAEGNTSFMADRPEKENGLKKTPGVLIS